MNVDGDGFLTEQADQRAESAIQPHLAVFERLNEILALIRAFIKAHSVPVQESETDHQRIIALVLATRILEISEAGILIMRKGMTNESMTMLRVFLDAYFVFGNVCTNPGFVKEYFQTDLRARLKLMNVSQQHSSTLFASARAYADQEKDNLKSTVDSEGAKAFKSEEYAKNIGCSEIYDSLYRLTSPSLHTTPRSLEKYTQEDDAGNITDLVDGPQPGDIGQHAYDFAHFLINVLGGLRDVFGETDSENQDELKDKLNASVNKIS
ncbi:hypothetical protein Q7C_1476 [Methylophaga frappieri]|uniref:Uncharacterized protein n=1 Tax=Methylophaga frappieri (strain ATCC BAA-2434 / DSM 25690 / JAM7) TaxID=754477 RepID=I1YI82_METFJ|nr:DUF5677 domain-containing protein [Methylophaga frappieri]AFJ02625.1 hypothetical protein Q7C_1476 [Methylophaga frappieri]